MNWIEIIGLTPFEQKNIDVSDCSRHDFIWFHYLKTTFSYNIFGEIWVSIYRPKTFLEFTQDLDFRYQPASSFLEWSFD
jgi:hypothetical protein